MLVKQCTKAGAYNGWTFFVFFVLFAEILFSSHIAPYSWTEFFYSRVFRIGRNCYDASPPLTVNHKTIILCRFRSVPAALLLHGNIRHGTESRRRSSQ